MPDEDVIEVDVAQAALVAGTLDSTFNGNGGARTSFSSNDVFGTGVAQAISHDGLFVAGTVGKEIALVRYLPGGSELAGFGTPGTGIAKFKVPNAQRSRASALLRLSSDSLVIAGNACFGSNCDACSASSPCEERAFLLRANEATGAVFDSFGNHGFAVSNLSSGQPESFTALAEDPSRAIVAAGYASLSNSTTRIALARYRADGTRDSTFGSGGLVLAPSPSGFREEYGLSVGLVSVQGEIRILVNGVATDSSGKSRGIVRRFRANGDADLSFGRNGYAFGVTPEAEVGHYGRSMVVQRDGRIVIAGELSNKFFFMKRYLFDGSPDLSFGSNHNSFEFNDFPETEREGARAIIQDSAGRLVVAGVAGNASLSSSRFAVARYSTGGVLDTRFNSKGYSLTAFRDAAHSEALAVLEQSDDKIVVAGFADNAFALARYVVE